MTAANLGVAGWLLAWGASPGHGPPIWAGGSAAESDLVEAELAFDAPTDFPVPASLPLAVGGSDGFAMLQWSLEGEGHACAFESDGEAYQRVGCDVVLPESNEVTLDYVAVWSDVENVGQQPGGRIFIDFTGGGILLRCDNVTHFLGDVNMDEVDVATYCD